MTKRSKSSEVRDSRRENKVASDSVRRAASCMKEAAMKRKSKAKK